MQVRVLGPVELRGDDGDGIAIGQRRVSEPLSVLALAGQRVTSEEIQTLVWVTVADGLLWSPEQTVHESRAIIAAADVTVVSSARAYDDPLGGKDNVEVDRREVASVGILAR